MNPEKRAELRTLNVPERVTVEQDGDGNPRAVRPPSGSARRIESILECWRIDDEWWRRPISRLCYEVTLETGGRVALLHDLITDEWWMQKP
jgi:hypothetical protein